jgi:hypothetical protein
VFLQHKDQLSQWKHRWSSRAEYLYLDVRRPLFVLACFALTFVIFAGFAGLH